MKDIQIDIDSLVEIYLQRLNILFSQVDFDVTNLDSLFNTIKSKLLADEELSVIAEPLTTSFFHMFYSYLFHKNYQISPKIIKGYTMNHMSKGYKTIKHHMEVNGFFSVFTPIERKLFLERLNNVFNSTSSKRDVCYISSNTLLKHSFFDTIWNFIDFKFFPTLFQKFAAQKNQYIQLMNQGDESGRIALFHLGLLGAYERGEVN